jgi:hypothetical protein
LPPDALRDVRGAQWSESGNGTMRNMRITARLLVALACAVALVGACSRAETEWQPLVVHEGGFSILMRGQAQYQRQVLDTPAGRMDAHLYSSDRPDAFFAVGYSDYPLALVHGGSPEALFTGVRDTWVRRLEGRLTSADNRITAGPYAGYAFSARGKAQGADALLDARLYLVDQRLYQIVAISRGQAIAQGTVNRYLDSFKLIEAAQIGSIRIEPAKK